MLAVAACEGLVVNRKRTHRLWLDEGLKRPARARKKRRLAYRPHGSLDWLTPDAYRQQWITNRQPTLSEGGSEGYVLFEARANSPGSVSVRIWRLTRRFSFARARSTCLGEGSIPMAMQMSLARIPVGAASRTARICW